MLNLANSQHSSGSFCQIYRVTDEALIAETAAWPEFFLMNVFFALKGCKFFIIIYSIYSDFDALRELGRDPL